VATGFPERLLSIRLSFGFDGAVSPLAQGRNRSFDRPVVIAPLFFQHADFHKRIERLFRI
jgi:hypothetical protein